MKPIVTKEMIAEAIREWARRQEEVDAHNRLVVLEWDCIPGLPKHTPNDKNCCIPFPKEWELCAQCGRDTRIYHEYTKDCKDGVCKEDYPDEDSFKD